MKQIHIGTDGREYVQRERRFRFDFCASSIFEFFALGFTIIIIFFFIQLFG